LIKNPPPALRPPRPRRQRIAVTAPRTVPLGIPLKTAELASQVFSLKAQRTGRLTVYRLTEIAAHGANTTVAQSQPHLVFERPNVALCRHHALRRLRTRVPRALCSSRFWIGTPLLLSTECSRRDPDLGRTKCG